MNQKQSEMPFRTLANMLLRLFLKFLTLSFFFPLLGFSLLRYLLLVTSLLCLVTPLIQAGNILQIWIFGQSNGQLDSKSLESCYLGSTEELSILEILCEDCV